MVDPVRGATVVDCCGRHDHELMYPGRDALESHRFVGEYYSGWRSACLPVCCRIQVLRVRFGASQESDELDRSEHRLQAPGELRWQMQDHLQAHFGPGVVLPAQDERLKQVSP